MFKGRTIIDKCNTKFQKIFSDYSSKQNGKIIVSHFGEFSQDLVNSLTISIENVLQESGDSKGITKRMFSILVEGLQNIRIHGENDEDGTQVSFLVILQNQSFYKVMFGNLILNKNIPKIEEHLYFLNNNDLRVVKQKYMEVLSDGTMSSKGGAGLGFITMKLKTKKNIHFNTEPVSDVLSCLSVEVMLDR